MKRLATILAMAAAVSLPSAAAAHAATTPSPSAGATSATPLERVNAYVQPSIAHLTIAFTGVVYDTFNKRFLNEGEPFTIPRQCTGFVVNPNGYIATAGHCLEYDSGVTAKFIAAAAQWAVENQYYEDKALTADEIVDTQEFVVLGPEQTGTPTPEVTAAWGASVAGVEIPEKKAARIVSSQKFEEGDAALLKVEATELNAIQLATSASVEVGEDIVAIGYPVSVDSVTDADLHPSFKPGHVSSVKKMNNGLLTVYELSAAVSGGMSGGPTVDMSGRVVGINSFGAIGEPQAFNFVNPGDRIAELMAAAGVRNEPSPTSVKYRKGLEAFFAGDKVTAVTALTAVTNDQPTNGLAATYLKKASNLPDPKVAPSIANFVRAAAAFVVTSALAVLVWLRNRRRTPQVGAAGPARPANEAGSDPRSPTPAMVPPQWGSAVTPTPQLNTPTNQNGAGHSLSANGQMTEQKT